MNTWKIILATMVIFAAGVVTGGLLVRDAMLSRVHKAQRGQALAHPAQPVSPGAIKIEFLRRIQRELDLAPDQRERIDRIITESQQRTREVVEKAKREFRQVLTPAQQARFDQLVKQQQQRAREQRRLAPPREAPLQPAPTNSP